MSKNKSLNLALILLYDFFVVFFLHLNVYKALISLNFAKNLQKNIFFEIRYNFDRRYRIRCRIRYRLLQWALIINTHILATNDY